MENNNMNDSNKNNNVNNNKDNQDIDIESYQVCSDPCIWVFDDLLSDAILEHVDDNFCPQLTTFPNNNKNQIDTESVGTWVRRSSFGARIYRCTHPNRWGYQNHREQQQRRQERHTRRDSKDKKPVMPHGSCRYRWWSVLPRTKQ